MVAVPPNRSGARRGATASAPRRDWRQWVILGLLFGLGHGITQRLIRGQGDGSGPAGHQNFGIQPFPGESLEALRRRYGTRPEDVRVDFEALDQEKRNQQELAETEKRRTELEDRQRAEDHQAQQEAERARLDALDKSAGASVGAPALPPLESVPPPSASPEPSAPSTERSPAAGTGLQLPPLPEAPPAPNPASRP